MSHVAKIQIIVKDLKVLEKACKRLGAELILNKKEYKWFGRHVGDYPMPEGMTPDDLGKCDHVIHHPDAQYEIGVMQSKTNPKNFELMWDFWSGGQLVSFFGNDAAKLKQAYGLEAAKKAALLEGYTCQEKQNGNKIRLTVTMPE